MSIQGIGNGADYQMPQVSQENAEWAEQAKNGQVPEAGQAPDAARGRESIQAPAATQAPKSAAQELAPAREPKLAERPRFDRYEPERKEEICTTDTGKVDREIEKLREKKTQLSEQVRATDDPQKKEALQRQLDQVERELAQKDNDTYRRQNAVVTGA